MHVFHDLDSLKNHCDPTALAIGNFDGCHIGHRQLLSHVVARAAEANLVSTVLTFYPHPVEVLNPGVILERLTTTDEKLALFKALGVEQVAVLPFSSEVSRYSPQQFVELYLDRGLKAKQVYVGANFRFGFERAGDTTILERLCRGRNIKVRVIEKIEWEGVPVSSSRIREKIRKGEVERAMSLLGRPYSLEGKVVVGSHRGKGLGFATANISIPSGKVLPLSGVYTTGALWQDELFISVCNLGTRPTFDPSSEVPSLEVHLLDFQRNLYEESLRVFFLKRLREERRFESPAELVKQIERDVEQSRAWKEGHGDLWATLLSGERG